MKKRREIYLTDKNYIINTDNLLFLAGFLFSVFWYYLDLKNFATGFIVIPTLLSHRFLIEVIPNFQQISISLNIFLRVMINGLLWGYCFYYIGKNRKPESFITSLLLIMIVFNLFALIPEIIRLF